MTWLDNLADPAALKDQTDAIQLDDKAPSPTTFQGFGHATKLNLEKGGFKVLNLLGTIGAYSQSDYIEQNIDLTPQQITQRNQQDAKRIAGKIKELTPNPASTGTAGQYISPLFDVIPRTVAGSLIGGPVLGAVAAGAPEYQASKATAMDEGIDANTASKKALLDSSIMAAGAVLPGGHIVKNVVGDAALAIGGNVGLGVASRASTSKLLEANGYHVQADQYKAFDKNAMAVDAILGSAFFGVSRLTGSKPTQDAIDSALTENQTQHLAVETAPGAPIDVKSNMQHQANVEQAISQLVNDQPVQVVNHDMAFIAKPRGIRNNNPGNIVNDATPWQGKVGHDGRFAQFESPEMGIRAMAKNLLTYQDKYNLTNVNDIIKRYAPPNENDTGAYVAAVAKEMGVKPNATLNLHDTETLGKLTNAIIRHENGSNPYTAEQVSSGITRALNGVNPETAGATVRNQLSLRSDIPENLRNSIADKYDAVSKTKPGFDQAIRDIASQSGSTHDPLVPYDMKGSHRAADKIISDYGGSVDKIKDLNRATIVVDNFDQAINAIQGVRDKFGDVISLRNHLSADSQPLTLDGYRDIKMNVMVDGHIAEVQINTPEMIKAKEAAHPFYEDVQSIIRGARNENRKLTAEENAKIDILEAKQKQLYEDAWRETSKRNEASLSNVPFLRADIYGNSRGAESQAVQERSGAIETGTPSTSANLVPSGNDLGNLSNIDLTPSTLIIQQGLTGKQNTAYTERGEPVNTQYSVVDTSQLTTSHDNNLTQNPNYPQELQPRDRSRDASEAQISKIENKINPELLAESPKVSDGAPIVGADGVVESGNARSIALRRAYESGKAGQYKEWLVQNAQRFGFDAAEVAKLDNPVLVRVRHSDVNRAEFARQANESNVAQMSTTEQANADVNRLHSLDGLVANEDGSINIGASGQFIRDFLQNVISPNEHGAMITADGNLSQQGLARITRAIFAKAYHDPELLAMLSEATDSNIKNIMSGMMRAAPAIARLKDMVDAGARYSFDITPDLAEAVRKFSQLRLDKTSVDQFLAQSNLFGDAVNPEVKSLLIGLQENSRSSKRVADMINKFVDAVEQLGDPRQGSMFSDKPASTSQFIDHSVNEMRRVNDTPSSQGLFDTPELAAAKQVVDSNPGLVLEYDENGKPVTVAEAMQQAQDEIVQAETDSKAYEAAIHCFMRTE